jgi:hypothetical protein
MLQEIIPPTLASIGEERLRWLEELPFRYSQEGFSLVHASPSDLWRAPMPNASDDELETTYGSLRAQSWPTDIFIDRTSADFRG